MILDLKQTTIAYFCPRCTHAVFSMVGVFSLSGDMIRLRCSCGRANETSLTISYTSDRRIRLSVPCLCCPSPHNFVLGSEVFFGQQLFMLACPYTGLDVAFIGDEEQTAQAVQNATAEMLDMMAQAGIENIAALRGDDDGDEQPLHFDDGQIEEIVRFMLAELREDGKIMCSCSGGTCPDVGFEVDAEGVRIYCGTCKAQTRLPLYGVNDATAFISTDQLTLA